MAFEDGHVNLGQILHDQLHHLQPLGQIKERMLGWIRCDGHDHLVEDAQASCNDIGMPVRNRVKGTGVYTDFHTVASAGNA
jgi:hypothetical protein